MHDVTRLAAFSAATWILAFQACAPPPTRVERAAGSGGTGAGNAGFAGSSTSGASALGGDAGSMAGSGDSENDAGASSGGTGGTGGSKGGKGGTGGSKGGKGGMANAEGGNPSAAGETSLGGEGGQPTNTCPGVTLGKSGIPAGPGKSVARPAGNAQNFKVIDWAGFKGALSFTFDDSLQSQLDHYAELNAVGVRMTFYDVCANDGSKAGWKTIANDGHEIGNHTVHHCYADGTGCSWGTPNPFAVDTELDDCTAHIESAFGVVPYTMAAPMGDPNWDAPASERFLANRGVNDIPAGVKPNDSTDPYNLPCHIAAQGETAAGSGTTFNSVTDSVRAGGSWRIILNHALGASDGYHPVDPAEVVAAMTYARDFGDVWVDTLKSIAAYWRAQKMMTSVTPTTSDDGTTWSWTLPAHFPPNQYLRVKVDGGTLSQCGQSLAWDEHGYYEIALDAGQVTLSP